jgi:hypothetical protein
MMTACEEEEIIYALNEKCPYMMMDHDEVHLLIQHSSMTRGGSSGSSGELATKKKAAEQKEAAATTTAAAEEGGCLATLRWPLWIVAQQWKAKRP